MNWKEIVQHYISKHSTQIRKVTRPLRDHFGIGYFTYHRIDDEGKYTVLLDRPDWAEHYVENQIYLKDPFLRHPSSYESGITLIRNHGSTEYRKEMVQKARDVLKEKMGALFIQREKNAVVFYGFSGATSLFMNHAPLFWEFGRYFQMEMAPILRKMEEEASSLAVLKGEDFFHKERVIPKISNAKAEAFLRELGKSYPIESLSSREKECLRLLAQKKTAKETGEILQLTTRTIEFYFENIKNKLSCRTKKELYKFSDLL